MRQTNFIQLREDRSSIGHTCSYIASKAHTLKLMSLRQRMTVTELRIQVAVLQQCLYELDAQLAQTTVQEASGDAAHTPS